MVRGSFRFYSWVRFAAKDADDLLVFARRQLMLGDDFRRDRGLAHARTAACSIDFNTTSPSEEPISASVARSG